MLKTSIEKLMQKQNLEGTACQQAIAEMLSSEANSLQSAAFLVLLRSKTETSEELSGMIAALKQKMLTVSTQHKVLDIVGTGGDGAQTINISTGSAILAASCGVKIAKHGNRAVSSLSGSADVLEALGIDINLSAEKISAGIDEIGIGFCFAPNFHPAIRELRLIRKQLNVPTTFNILGPLLNPANPGHYLLGVYDESLLCVIADTLKLIGTERSIVAHGGSIDEMSGIGPVKIFEITPSNIQESILDPESLGIPRCRIEDLKGGNAQTNAQILLDVFSGKHSNTAIQAIAGTLILNAATALYLYGQHKSIAAAIPHARENLLSGMALDLLKKWQEFTHD